MVKNEIKLSILVCTVPSRVDNYLPKIILELEKQAKDLPVEIIYLGDNKKMSIGEKRNNLLLMSKGKYACFIDDDDEIDEYYIKTIIKVIDDNNPDSIVFQVMYKDINKNVKKLVKYSIEYQKDYEDDNYFYRIPNHLMPIKMEILNKIWFKEVNFGEDFDFATQIKPHIKTQSSISKVLYYYNFDKNQSESIK